jgi:endonuclease YncB( thermonuclease family)
MKRASAVTTVGLVMLLLAPALAAAPKEPLPSTLTGKVVAIADGDTLTVLVGRTQHRIRLDSIDCPERGPPFARGGAPFRLVGNRPSGATTPRLLHSALDRNSVIRDGASEGIQRAHACCLFGIE